MLIYFSCKLLVFFTKTIHFDLGNKEGRKRNNKSKKKKKKKYDLMNKNIGMAQVTCKNNPGNDFAIFLLNNSIND
jgi:hypothetical protein